MAEFAQSRKVAVFLSKKCENWSFRGYFTSWRHNGEDKRFSPWEDIAGVYENLIHDYIGWILIKSG